MHRRAVVTGAFSYIGAAVARELCGRGWQVHTLTRRHAPPGEMQVTGCREELDGLEQELLVSRAPALGRESVGSWLLEHGAALGRRYVNDRERHFGLGHSQPILIP